MGMYINPIDMSKEQWLGEHGFMIPQSEAPYALTDKTMPVCHVDNGAFTAAGIGFCKEEIEAFSQPDDRRPKQWFVVHRDDLKPFLTGPLADG